MSFSEGRPFGRPFNVNEIVMYNYYFQSAISDYDIEKYYPAY